jgi:hypothetical protein
MEEENEKVVEKTTQETIQKVDESKFKSAGNDNVIKVDLNAPQQEKVELQEGSKNNFQTTNTTATTSTTKTDKLANKIIPTIQSSGGRVLVRKKVKQILIKNNKAVGVEMENGDKIYANKVISAAGFELISVPQTIIFFFFVASKSMDLLRIPEVMIYFNLGKLSINVLVMGVRSLIINIASKSSSSTIASFSSLNGLLNILNSNLSLCLSTSIIC